MGDLGSEICEKGGERILTSTYPPISIPKLGTLSAVEIILEKVQENVEKGLKKWITNCITGDEILMEEVEPLTKSVASALVKRGMGPGGVAIYVTHNVTHFYIVLMGIWRAGGIVHTSHPTDSSDLLLTRFEDTKAARIFCDPDFVAQAKEVIAQVKWAVEIFVFGQAVEGTISVDQLLLDDGQSCPEKAPNPGPDEPILIVATSGTTGKSKAGIYTNRVVAYTTLLTKRNFSNGSPHMYFNKSLHMTGIFFPLQDLCTGVWAIMMHEPNKENILKGVQKYKPIFVFGFPRFLHMLVDSEARNFDLSSIEVIWTGGCVIPDHFRETMANLPNLKHLVNSYGLTECTFVSTAADLGDWQNVYPISDVPGLSVGRIVPNTSIKVIDLHTGKALGPNERGELYVQSPFMASGYLNRPEDTAVTFDRRWLRTGDIAYYDENGFVFVLDRVNETFICNNERVCPTEIENEISKHPAVLEVIVFGVIDPLEGGHFPRAVVELKPNQNATAKDIEDFYNGIATTDIKLGGGVMIVDSVPRTSSGKLSRAMAAKLPLLN